MMESGPRCCLGLAGLDPQGEEARMVQMVTVQS